MNKKFGDDKIESAKKRELKATKEPGIDLTKQVELEGDDVLAQTVAKAAKRLKAAETAAARETSEFIEKVVSINRITKVTKGGKKLSFSALVVVGDTKGRVGYSLEKASEVSIAIRKAMNAAKGQMIKVSMKGTSIPHEIIGECGSAKVLLKPAGEGTGVIAAGPVRAVCDGAGIRNILTKCHRSNNPINVVKATFNGLSRLKQVII